MKKLYSIKLWFLFLFLASLGYEFWDPFGVRSFFTITKFFGIIYALLSVLDFKSNFRINKQNKVLIFSMLLMWLWMLLVTLFKTVIYVKEPNFMFSILQVIIMFWLVFNDVDKNPKVKNKLFLSFILGVFSISILLNFGIGIQTHDGNILDTMDGSRVYFMGMNPNAMGNLASLSILLIVQFVFGNNNNNNNNKRYLLLAFIPNLLYLIGISGSRGSFFILIIGILIFFGLKKTSIGLKITYLFIGSFLLFFFLDYLSGFDKLQNRLISTYETNDTGNRTELWEAAIKVFFEHPIFGVGYDGLSIEMSRISTNVTAHNVFLDFAIMGGIIAFVLYINFIRIILVRSWKSLKLYADAGKLMVLICILFILFKSGGGYDSKMSWIMLAIIAPFNRK